MTNEETPVQRPELAIIASQIIHIGSQLESLQPLIIASLLGTRAEPIIAIINNLNNPRQRAGIVEVAATTTLNDKSLRVFKAILKYSQSFLKHRHRLAHDLWGYCEEHPDVLLLQSADSRLAADLAYRDAMRHWKTSGDGSKLDAQVRDDSTIMTYSKRDLEEARTQGQTALELTARFMVYADPMMANKAEFALDDLIKQPAMAKRLAR